MLKINIREDFMEEAHEVLAGIFFAMTAIHLLGLFTDMLFHAKIRTLQSMLTGNKHIEGENSKSNILHKIFSIIWFVIPFLAFIYGTNLKSEKNKENNSKEHYEQKNEDDHDDDDD